ncbi:ergothioneine biosynthesis protein EgtB [Dyella sp. C11]|uniref:ergothioneine biosynthesis protein EgtB n=1 Tax=Dyella sp. C11 TaxID=2126991 RepID=UPI000D644B25|nr:ergothioneine biosynthesis protein EgtB [Dyella sp. C11]
MTALFSAGIPAAIGEPLLQRFLRLRSLTEALCDPLSDAEASAQSMPDASPAKWHLAHTTWFFETFVLRDHLPGYRQFNSQYPYLFNSYYEAEGARVARASRGLLIRPSIEEIYDYRAHVNFRLAAAWSDLSPRAKELIELGCHHEEQHQELIVMDLQHLMHSSPLQATPWPPMHSSQSQQRGTMSWIEREAGLVSIGADGDGFVFDCERPRHRAWLDPYALADRLVTNREWRDFIDDSGYRNPALWLSDGWAWVNAQQIAAPQYWRKSADGEWGQSFGLGGWSDIRMDAPVCHVSYYEADAYARWAGARLPTEPEWESAAESCDSSSGTFLDGPGAVAPKADLGGHGLRQLFGDVWEWTASAFLGHPGFRAEAGAIGEYNGKFMSGQFVLKGGSCATPRGHVRASYRNFFYPHQRWQFAGVRLARSR